MNGKPSNDNNNDKKPQKKNRFNFYWIYGLILLGFLALQFLNFDNTEQISQKKFEQEMLLDDEVDFVEVVNDRYVEVYLTNEALDMEEHKDVSDSKFGGGKNPGPHYTFQIGDPGKFEEDIEELQNDQGKDKAEYISVKYSTRTDWTGQILSWVIPIAILVIIWLFIMRRVTGGMGGAGNQIFNVGKSKASLYDKNTRVNVTFDDVAGLEEAKEEVMEVVDFLKNPKKYTALGGKIPKGVILVGPPGTGKTLIAKAMAGEAQVPFFSISGSDFVEMFVGVGASRVRDLFKQAREKAPCIIFIDEIDAIGRARGKQLIQGNDERENTLNQLLVEMDGFSSEKGVIIVAATNRPDVLDSALMRPGRFDRQIGIDKPDLNAREQIFGVHLKPLKLAAEISAKRLAEQTPGFVGADIANICNEAALIAARRNKTQIEMIDFQDAIDRSIGGLEKKNKLISPDEKKIIAYHEAGHAIAGWYLEHADPLLKVTIVPRGVAALGYAQYLPKEQYLMDTDQFADRMCKTLAGRAAEEIVFGKISTGAQNDLDVITKMAYSMVTVYGMNKEIGNVSFYGMQQGEYTFTKPYSDETAYRIDKEVKQIIEEQYKRAKDLLTEKYEKLELLAQKLLEKEVIFKHDLEDLIGPRPFEEEDKEPMVTEEMKENSSTPQPEEDKASADDKANQNGASSSDNTDSSEEEATQQHPEV